MFCGCSEPLKFYPCEIYLEKIYFKKIVISRNLFCRNEEFAPWILMIPKYEIFVIRVWILTRRKYWSRHMFHFSLYIKFDHKMVHEILIMCHTYAKLCGDFNWCRANRMLRGLILNTCYSNEVLEKAEVVF